MLSIALRQHTLSPVVLPKVRSLCSLHPSCTACSLLLRYALASSVVIACPHTLCLLLCYRRHTVLDRALWRSRDPPFALLSVVSSDSPSLPFPRSLARIAGTVVALSRSRIALQSQRPPLLRALFGPTLRAAPLHYSARVTDRR
jgi:hypothetical protein